MEAMTFRNFESRVESTMSNYLVMQSNLPFEKLLRFKYYEFKSKVRDDKKKKKEIKILAFSFIEAHMTRLLNVNDR